MSLRIYSFGEVNLSPYGAIHIMPNAAALASLNGKSLRFLFGNSYENPAGITEWYTSEDPLSSSYALLPGVSEALTWSVNPAEFATPPFVIGSAEVLTHSGINIGQPNLPASMNFEIFVQEYTGGEWVDLDTTGLVTADFPVFLSGDGLQETTDVQALVEGEPVPSELDFNCDCDCGYPTTTLAQLRNNVAIAMGYSSQLASLPASFRTMVDYNLNMQQRLVLADLTDISNVRYFSWGVLQGQTKFCVTDNLETCRSALAATKISEAYIIRAGNDMIRLNKGIDLLMQANDNPQSIPSRYDVGSCISIWPPPSEDMTLVVRGALAHVPMVADSDVCMIDPVALELRTIAFMKGNKGHPDAGNYMGQYGAYIGSLCADSHLDQRYIPNARGRFTDREIEILTHVMQRRIYSDGSGS